MASIYDTDGSIICENLQGSNTCDQAAQTAERIAAERNKTIHLSDDDGEWLVSADGEYEQLGRDGDHRSGPVRCCNERYGPNDEYPSVALFLAMCHGCFGHVPSLQQREDEWFEGEERVLETAA